LHTAAPIGDRDPDDRSLPVGDRRHLMDRWMLDLQNETIEEQAHDVQDARYARTFVGRPVLRVRHASNDPLDTGPAR